MKEGWKTADFIIEQDLIAKWKGGRVASFTLRISKPVLKADENGERLWESWLLLDGLMEAPLRPVREVSSFRSTVVSLQCCRQLIRDETKGARLFMTGGAVLGDELFPSDGVALNELFEIY